MELQLLLFSWCICYKALRVVATNLSDFVTLQQQHKWTTDELKQVPLKLYNNRARMYWNQYSLRFHSESEQMPRSWWNKLPEATITPTVFEPAEPEKLAITTISAEEFDEYEESSTSSTLTTAYPSTTISTTTPATARMKLSTASTNFGSHVMHSIMKPPQIGNSPQKILFLGSPFKPKIWQQNMNRNTNKTRVNKGFLSLFEVIKFENTKCSVTMAEIDIRMSALEGICYHEFECKNLGGIPTEPCAEGVGVCCVFITGCGVTTKESVVYFESPNYPNPVREMLICVLIINLRETVQQLRLDFIMFELNRPTDGDCMDDQFIVSGQSVNFIVPILCGINTGQHIYVDVTNSFEKKIYISFITKVITGERSFNIKIVQLDDDLAPEGCLQYFSESEGIVKSFNYDSEGAFVNTEGATYLNNLNYAICLKRAKDTCSINYNNEENVSEQPNFQIVNKDEDEGDLVPDGQAGVGIFNCPDDYIAINQVRLCGERLNDGTISDDFTQNAPIKDVAAGPIILPVRTDDEYVGRGFRLVYKQELCV